MFPKVFMGLTEHSMMQKKTLITFIKLGALHQLDNNSLSHFLGVLGIQDGRSRDGRFEAPGFEHQPQLAFFFLALKSN